MIGRFFRSRDITNVQGTGPGLNSVAKYLEVRVGTINFKCVLNIGTIFYISVPHTNS